jgi:hypothetical protein
MAWTDVPHNHITFGLFSGSTAGATVSVATGDLKLCRYKALANDTLVVDFRIAKAFFNPTTCGVSGVTMELAIPYGSVYFAGLGAPSSFFDAGQSYSNDCAICLDPGGLSYVPGCVVVLNEQNHKIVLLIRNVPGTNLNPNNTGVIGAFGQITFEVTHRDHRE